MLVLACDHGNTENSFLTGRGSWVTLSHRLHEFLLGKNTEYHLQGCDDSVDWEMDAGGKMPCGHQKLETSTVLSQHSGHVAEIRNEFCVPQREKKASRNSDKMEHVVKACHSAHLALWLQFIPCSLTLCPCLLFRIKSSVHLCGNLGEFTPSWCLFISAYLIIFHLEQETEEAPRWFLLMNVSSTSGRDPWRTSSEKRERSRRTVTLGTSQYSLLSFRGGLCSPMRPR